MNTPIRIILAFHLIFSSAISMADYKDDISYTKLATELGQNIPDGSGVLVSQAEGDTDGAAGAPYNYFPDTADSQFSGKIIIDVTNINNQPSSHATVVGRLFYGINSMASGADSIDVYFADAWLVSGFLNYGVTNRNKTVAPKTSTSRTANHSWVADLSDVAVASSILRRTDYIVEAEEFIQVVGIKNSAGVNPQLLGSAFNVIAVGKSHGSHGIGTPAIDLVYVADRTNPDIVAPYGYTSNAAPVVNSAAVLLIETGHADPGLSTDPIVTSTLKTAGRIYNAERSEVIKASLMAGADRLTKNRVDIDDIVDYRVDTANRSNNGLDKRFGAGQVNVYNSYHIIAAGEQNSSEDGGVGSSGIGVSGFDYDPYFGGSSSSNTAASYYFSTGVNPGILSATLAWNIGIAGGTRPFNEAATFHDLDLYLYDVTGSQIELVNSISSIDNTENIWTSLTAGRDYLLQVVPKAGQGNFSWDYALAWQIATDTDGDGISDTQEVVLGTNPLITDTDGDGLLDMQEVVLTTNPLITDTDGDGLSDFDEVNMDGDPTTYTLGVDTDPLIADTDGDTYDDGIDVFSLDPAEWLDTDGDGTGNNADLDDDNDGVSDLLETDPLNPYLCGDSDGDTCDDCSVGTDNFGPLSDQLPDNDGQDSDIDGLCNVGDLDDDNDGLLDIYETDTGLFVSSTDTGTSPLIADTDGDGYGDGEEVSFGSNPLNDASLPIAANGDLNNDGVVNVVDVMIGQQILNDQVDPTLEQLHYGDVAPLVDGAPASDGLFNVGDLVVIQRMATGLVSF